MKSFFYDIVFIIWSDLGSTNIIIIVCIKKKEKWVNKNEEESIEDRGKRKGKEMFETIRRRGELLKIYMFSFIYTLCRIVQISWCVDIEVSSAIFQEKK